MGTNAFTMATPPEFYLGEWPQYNRDERVRTSVLELATELVNDAYVPQWFVVPGSADQPVAGRGNVRSTLQVHPGSYLVGVRSFSANSTAQFSVTIFENTSNRTVSNRPILSSLIGGNPATLTAKKNFTPRISWGLVKSPFIVLSEGTLTIELTNLSTTARRMALMLLFAVPKGAVGDLDTVATLTQKVLGDNPLVSTSGFNTQGLVSPPWVVPPDGYKSFDYAMAIPTPAVVGVDTPIVSFNVPQGMDGVIKRISNGLAGIGFVDGGGDIVWRIFIDGSPVQGYDNITVRLGEINNPTLIEGIRIRSNQAVSLVVNNVTGLIPVGGTQATGRLGGYFYPGG